VVGDALTATSPTSLVGDQLDLRAAHDRSSATRVDRARASSTAERPVVGSTSDHQRATQEPVVDGLELGSSFLLARVELGVAVEHHERVTVGVPFLDPCGGGRAELLGLIDDDDVDEPRSTHQLVGSVPR